MDATNKDNNTNETWPSYSQYLGYCSKLNITSELSLEEWKDFGNTGKLEDKHHHGLGFAPFMPGMPAKPSFLLPKTSPLLNPSGGFNFGAGVSGMLGPDNIISKIFDLYEEIADPAKSNSEKVKTAVRLVLEEVADNASSKGGNIKVKPEDMIRAASLKSSPTSFSVKMPAVESSYSPEIPNTLFSDYYRTAAYRDANLYVTSLNWSMPANEPQVIDYVTRILVPDLQTRANISVNFNVNAEQVFTFGKVSSYMTTVMLAMQTYYSYANIIAYCGKTGHTNTGMYSLRGMIDAQDINQLSLLGERLNNIPIPPRLRELSYWMCNIYKSQNQCPNSPIMLMVPFSFTSGGDSVDNRGDGYYTGIGPSIDGILDKLNPGVNNPLGADFFNDRFINMLAKVCPGWLGTPMGSADGIPLHDPHWMDVWTNSPCKVISASATTAETWTYNVPYLFNGDDRGEEIKYVTHCETISGINQALFSTWQYNSPVQAGWSGMLSPVTSISIKLKDGTYRNGLTNRFIFGSSDQPSGGYQLLYAYSGSNEQSDGIFEYANSQSGWYNTPSENEVSNTGIGENALYIPVDCQPANGMNLSSNANPSYQSTRWLMSFDEALSGPGSDNRRPARKRSRGKKGKLTTDE